MTQDSNLSRAHAVLDAQAAKGLRKYRVPLEAAPLTVAQLARYGAEEAADQLAYFVALEAKLLRLAALEQALRGNVGLRVPMGEGRVIIEFCDDERACNAFEALSVLGTPKPAIDEEAIKVEAAAATIEAICEAMTNRASSGWLVDCMRQKGINIDMLTAQRAGHQQVMNAWNELADLAADVVPLIEEVLRNNSHIPSASMDKLRVAFEKWKEL